MPKNTNMKRAKSTPSKMSRRSMELIRLRRQRLYNVVGKVRRESPNASLSPQAKSPNAQLSATEELAKDSVSQPPVTITLLKSVSMTLHAPGDISFVVPLNPYTKRVHLLAYIAWMQGEMVKLDSICEYVFGFDKTGEKAESLKLREAFASHRKHLLKDLRDAAAKLNRNIGQELIPLDIDIFDHNPGFWWLSSNCHVSDLETIEADHRIIEKARKDGLLEVTISEEIKATCDDLIAAYTGDFLSDLIHIHAYPDAIDPSVPRWMRKPYTLYRDYYLQAVWYAGEFEQQVGQRYANECLANGDESRLKQLREHWGRAAEHYWTCAMHSCSSRFDLKVTFGIGKGVHGERVILSEWALRNCLLLYGHLGSTHLVDQLYSRYYRHMRHISGKMWEPSDALLRDLESAKENTGSYRIPKLMSSHDPPIPPD